MSCFLNFCFMVSSVSLIIFYWQDFTDLFPYMLRHGKSILVKQNRKIYGSLAVAIDSWLITLPICPLIIIVLRGHITIRKIVSDWPACPRLSSRAVVAGRRPSRSKRRQVRAASSLSEARLRQAGTLLPWPRTRPGLDPWTRSCSCLGEDNNVIKVDWLLILRT